MNLLLAVLATLRLTRFVTTDSLGEWWLVGPAKKWAGRYEADEVKRRVNRERQRHPYASQSKWVLHDGRTVDDPFEFITQDYDEHDPWTWQAKLVKGLDCPFCVGFWIGAGVLLSLTIPRAVPSVRPLWRFVMGALALNYVTGHISAKLD